MVVIQCPHCSLEVELDNGVSGLFDCPHCGEEFEWREMDESVSTFSGPASYWNRVALAISFFGLCLFALSAYQMNGGGSVWALIFCLAVFLLTTLIEMYNISLYFVSRLGREVEEPQHWLIAASYLCSTIGLLIGGIILGPIGFILGLVAKSNGDSRGKYAMISGVVVTVISLLISLLLFQ
jgi:hypothetical protein